MGKGLTQIVLDRLPSRDEIALEIYESDMVLGEAVVGWGSLPDEVRDNYRHNADAVLALIRERIKREA